MKKVLTSALSVFMALMLVITSSGMSVSFMRCHFSGKTIIGAQCEAHSSDQQKANPIVHQSCCDTGSFDLNVKLGTEKELEIEQVLAPVLFSIQLPILSFSVNQPGLSKLGDYIPFHPELSVLQVFRL